MDILKEYDIALENMSLAQQELVSAVLYKIQRLGKTKVSRALGYDQSYLSNMLRRKNSHNYWRNLYVKITEIEQGIGIIETDK